MLGDTGRRALWQGRLDARVCGRCLHYRGHFPTHEAVFKLLHLALANIEEKWERSLRDWSNVLGQFSIFFKDRIPA